MDITEVRLKHRERERALDMVVAILEEHGIRMSVSGCGCCGSPDVRFEYKGSLIIDDSEVNFNMFEEE